MLKKIAEEVDSHIFTRLSEYRQLFPIAADARYYLLKSCRHQLNQVLKLRCPRLSQCVPSFLLNQNAITFISLCFRGRTLICIASGKDNILTSALSATKISAEYLLSNFSNKYYGEIYLEVYILFNAKKVSVKQFRKSFIQGLHGISLETDKGKAFFKNSVSVQHSFDTDQLLENLYKKMSGKGRFKVNQKNVITLYDSIEFREDFLSKNCSYNLFDFFRCNVILLQKEITLSFVKKSIHEVQSCLQQFIESDGQMFYEINTVAGEKIKSNTRAATIRKLASLWALGCNTTSKILKAKKVLKEQLDEEDIGVLSFVIFLEGEFGFSREFHRLSQKLLKKFQQQKWEKINLELWLTKVVSLNALLVCAEKTTSSDFLKLAEKHFPSCEALLNNEKEAYQLCGWLSRFAAKLYRLTGKNNYADFVIKLNKTLLQDQISGDFFLIDAIGAFEPNNQSRITSIYLESLTEGFKMATAQKDSQSCKLFYIAIVKALRPLLGNQLRADTAFDHFLLGAFKNSSVDLNIRIDNLQHALLALRTSVEVIRLAQQRKNLLHLG